MACYFYAVTQKSHKVQDFVNDFEMHWLSILLQDEFQPIVLCGLKFLMTSYDFAMLLNVWVSVFYVQHTYSRQSMIDGLINYQLLTTVSIISWISDIIPCKRSARIIWLKCKIDTHFFLLKPGNFFAQIL